MEIINNKKTITSRTVAIMLLAFYFLVAPLEDILTSNIGTLGKYIIILALFLLLIPIFSYGKISFARDIWGISRIVIYLIMLAWISVIWAIDTQTAISRNSAYTTLPLVFFVLSINEFSNDEYKILKKAAIIGGLLTIAFIIGTQGMTHVLSGRMTLNDMGNDPNNLAALFILPAGLAFDFFMNSKKVKRVFFLFVFGVLTLFTLFTGSRGGMFSLIIMLLVYFLIGGYIKTPVRAILLIAVLAFVVLIVINYLPQDIFNRLFTASSYQSAAESSGQRGAIWKHIIYDILPDMSPIGMGSGCAPLALSNIYGFNKGIHNTYLCMLVEYGVLGIPFFLVLLGKMIVKLKSHKRIIEVALLIGIMCTIFFLDSYAKKFFWNVMYIAMISLRTYHFDE